MKTDQNSAPITPHSVQSPNMSTILVRVRERAFTDNTPDVPSAHDSHSNFSSHENVNVPFPDPAFPITKP